MINIFEIFVSIEEVEADFQKVENIINTHGQAVVLKDNELKYAIIPISKYYKLNSISDELERSKDEEEINKLLNGIGKEIFINYYYEFKNNVDPFLFLEKEKFTDNSIRSRASKARTIFKKGFEIEAIRMVIDSRRTNPEAIEKAKQILKKEIEV